MSLLLAHFRHAHFANECPLLSDMQTDELVRKHIDAPPLTRSQFATNIGIAIIHTPKSQYRREVGSVPYPPRCEALRKPRWPETPVGASGSP